MAQSNIVEIIEDGKTIVQIITAGPQGPAGPIGPDAVWGLITGTLSDQTDLQAALDAEATGSINIPQTAHGFAVGEVLRHTGVENVLALAQADSDTTANAFGIVTEVIDVNNYTLTMLGLKDAFAGVLDDQGAAIVPGETYFLSDSVAGGFTPTQPSNPNVIKPIFNSFSASTSFIYTALGFQAAI